ncbi:MAG: IS21 family transposase [Lactobacillaceae bacterium]|jgi:transposase|nr:IS21 family transposase [Lactobacillaceae bacterium]
MRKDIKQEVEYYVMNEIKPNYTAIAEKFNCDPRTVKKHYLKKQETDKTNQKAPTKPARPSKLDDYRDIIKEKYEAECTAMAIFKFIEKKGFTGKYTIVKDYCRTLKQNVSKEATIRVKKQPGKTAQVDWKEDITFHDSQGNAYKFNIFLYILPYSQMKYITFTWDRKQDTLFKCLTEAFQYTKGVPEQIWFDNMKTVVNQARTQYRKVIFNQKFYEFSKDARFEPIACRSRRPQTKGSVESVAKFVERMKPYDRELPDITAIINQVSILCEEINSEVSQATNQITIDKFSNEEKEPLRPFNPEILTPYFEKDITRIVSKESLITFRRCKYSVPVSYIDEYVDLKPSDNSKQLNIYYNGDLIRSHVISEEIFNYHPDDEREILKSELMKHRTDQEITNFIENSLHQYDNL